MELKKLIKIKDDEIFLPAAIDIEDVVKSRYITLVAFSWKTFQSSDVKSYPLRFFEFRDSAGHKILLENFSPRRFFKVLLSLEGINHFFPVHGDEDQLADREVALIDYIERSVVDTGLRGHHQRKRWMEDQFKAYGIE